MNRFVSLPCVVRLMAVLGILILPALASAEERQYFLHGTARFVSPTDFVGSGEATYLGRYMEAGSAQFSPTAEPTVLRIDAWTVLTAANGDQLHETITGQLDLLTGEIIATITYVGGTGRFDDAGGSAELFGQMLPDGSITVHVDGTIDY